MPNRQYVAALPRAIKEGRSEKTIAVKNELLTLKILGIYTVSGDNGTLFIQMEETEKPQIEKFFAERGWMFEPSIPHHLC